MVNRDSSGTATSPASASGTERCQKPCSQTSTSTPCQATSQRCQRAFVTGCLRSDQT